MRTRPGRSVLLLSNDLGLRGLDVEVEGNGAGVFQRNGHEHILQPANAPRATRLETRQGLGGASLQIVTQPSAPPMVETIG